LCWINDQLEEVLMSSKAPALEMRGISKSFAGNAVLVDVDLQVAAGEVHALVGENGAGKSTLMKILAGVYQPDGGEIFMDGNPVHFARPGDALKSGIAMIFQELSLAPHLTVAENIFLGREPLALKHLGLIDRKALNERAAALLTEYGFRINARSPVSWLSAADRQLVEITRAIVEARRVIVMDEPTSSLTTNEVEELFRLIRDLRARGLAIVYISHRLEELDVIADGLSILRDGRAVYSGAWGAISTDEMIRHMAGRELKEIFPPRSAAIGDVKLRVEGLSRRPKFAKVSFEARSGEIVGIAGLAGAGRTEVVEAIFGAQPADEGRILVDGKLIERVRPRKAVEHSVSLLTEDRKRTGLCLNLSIANNVTLASVSKLVRGGRVQRRKEIEAAKTYISKLHIQPPQPSQPVGRLSGGNQQKTLLGRWLFADTKVFLLDEPTRGVDVAARVEIYRAINELAEAGAAIVMVSSDLPELLGMADRILVLRRGTLVAELDAAHATQEEILKFAAVDLPPQPLVDEVSNIAH
ncbi:MAG: sugar ABC transporter ATP-binding protein, partial [Acidobacteriota bacterium]